MRLGGHNPKPDGERMHRLRSVRAFTLIELLVVIGIIALLTAVGLPSIKNLAKAKSMAVAQRQLRDTFSYARQVALTSRSTVFVVFAPPNAWNLDTNRFRVPGDIQDYLLLNNLVGQQNAAYAVYTERSVGEQPGRTHPRYLTDWERLPESIVVPREEFGNTNRFDAEWLRFPSINSTNRTVAAGTPYPSNLNHVTAPVIAFNAKGQLTTGRDVMIPLAEVSILPQLNSDGTYRHVAADLIETKPSELTVIPGVTYYVRSGSGSIEYDGATINAGETFVGVPGQPTFTTVSGTPKVHQFEGIHINWLTGRAQIIRPKLQG